MTHNQLNCPLVSKDHPLFDYFGWSECGLRYATEANGDTVCYGRVRRFNGAGELVDDQEHGLSRSIALPPRPSFWKRVFG